MSKVISLFSGSSGNAFYISSGTSSILIDAGVSCKALCEKMNQLGISPQNLGGVILTHEHFDHIKGVRVFCDKFKIPLFASEGTLLELDNRDSLPKNARISTVRGEFEVADFLVQPFATPHDSRESFGYAVQTPDSKKISVCTDLGHITPTVRDALTGSNFVLIESNHDVDMLKNGSYPAVLKQRILGMFGHLSNKTCDEFLPSLIESGTTHIMLGHISQENNSLPLAVSCAKKTLFSNDMIENEDYLLYAAGVDGNEKFCVI